MCTHFPTLKPRIATSTSAAKIAALASAVIEGLSASDRPDGPRT